jgi:hypothetical protein
VIVSPPLFTGALHVTTADVDPAVAATDVGALGGPVGVKFKVGVEQIVSLDAVALVPPHST